MMELHLHGSGRHVNRVACLDAFLEDFSFDGSGDAFLHTLAKNAASPTATPTGSGNAAVGGVPLAEDGGSDLRALTSGTSGGGGGGGGRDNRSGGKVCPRGYYSRRLAGAAAAAARPLQAEVLKVLDFLFTSDRPLVESTVLDKSRVVQLVARGSSRSMWLVQGSRGAPYLCLREYCSCRSFQELVRRGGEHPVLVSWPPPKYMVMPECFNRLLWVNVERNGSTCFVCRVQFNGLLLRFHQHLDTTGAHIVGPLLFNWCIDKWTPD
ncbi:unnamed protein product [Pylaiella littoralis]